MNEAQRKGGGEGCERVWRNKNYRCWMESGREEGRDGGGGRWGGGKKRGEKRGKVREGRKEEEIADTGTVRYCVAFMYAEDPWSV